MPKKKLSAAEKRRRTNEQQKSYRQRNPELYDIWKQRSYANYLRKKNWKVVEPPNFPTPTQVREKRDTVQALTRLLDNGPLFDPDAFARMEPPAGPTMEADEDISDLFDVPDDLIKP